MFFFQLIEAITVRLPTLEFADWIPVYELGIREANGYVYLELDIWKAVE